jgi:lysozyme family protein
MADFLKYEPWIFTFEGKYSNTSGDSGGETYVGISRNNFPDWAGWTIVDQLRNLPNFPGNLDQNSTLQNLIPQFYIPNFWNPINGDNINAQIIADFVCDFGINAGVSTSAKHLQKVIGVTEDGDIGPETLLAVNSSDSKQLIVKLVTDRIAFYKDVAELHPQDEQFLTDWLWRANRFLTINA